MITKDYIAQICQEHLGDGKVYVTGIRVSADNKISVFIDGDEGVSIQDCVSLSRAIESTLNRDQEDFSLDVSSHGATSPLLFLRQYKRHQGRDVQILKTDLTKLEGTMVAVNETGLELQSSSRENKSLGKGKVTVTRTFNVPFTEIKETKLKLKY